MGVGGQWYDDRERGADARGTAAGRVSDGPHGPGGVHVPGRRSGPDDRSARTEPGDELGPDEPPNRPPEPQGDSAPNTGGVVWVDVLANDSDPDGDDLQVIGITQPAHGTAVASGSGVEYFPDAGYYGSDAFTYE